MEQKTNSCVRGPVARAVLTVVIVAVGLTVAGCGNQMARIDEGQLRLQTMVEANAQQIADIAARLEQNQQELHAVIGTVQNDVAKVAFDVAAVAEAQVKLHDTQMQLHDTVQNSNRQVTGKIASLEQNQRDMSASLGRAIAGVQSETRKVAADLTAVTAEQARLFETVRENNEQLTNKVAVIEQAQQQRQDTIGGMQDNIRAVAASITALGEDVLRLQEILQNNIRELVSIADITGQKQIEFQDSIKKDLLTLDESLASIRQNQSNLESRIEQMQNNGPDLSDVPAALDQLRDQLEELSRSSMVDEADSTEYDPSAETDSVE
jgi:chromosome segregation ATPase